MMDAALIIEDEGLGKRAKRSTRFSGDFHTTFAELESSEDEKAEKRRKSSSGKNGKRSKDCPGCGATLGLSVKQCTLCDYQFTSKSMIVTAQNIAQESLDVRDRFPFEPERDEDGSLFIQSIEGRRPRKTVRRWMRPTGSGNGRSGIFNEHSAQDTKFDYEFLVKYKNMSYRDVQWLSATEIEAMGTKNKNLLSRYLTRIDRGDGTANEDGEIDPSYLEVERVLDFREEEVSEVVDDVAGQNKAIADAAGEEEDEKEEEEEEEESSSAAPARSSTVALKAERTPELSSSSSNGLSKRASVESFASTENKDATEEGTEEGVAEAKPLTQGQINTMIFNPVERCRRVLEKLYEDPYSTSFQEPVDTELYTDYLDVVEEPMCLQTVSERLEAGAYSKYNGYMKFAKDIRKIWHNCKLYNLYRSSIWHCAHALSLMFERLFQAWVVSFSDGSTPMSEPTGCPWDQSCRVCMLEKNDDKVMLCDHCDAAYHIYCLSPPLKSVPEDAWVCPRCEAWFASAPPRAKMWSATTEDEARNMVEGAAMRKVVRVRKKKYLVKWRGLSYRECTWETAKAINDDEKIEEYHRINDSPPEEPALTQAEIGLELAKDRKTPLHPAGWNMSRENPVIDLDAQIYAQIRAFHFLKWNKVAPSALLRESGPATFAYAHGMRTDMQLPKYITDVIDEVVRHDINADVVHKDPDADDGDDADDEDEDEPENETATAEKKKSDASAVGESESDAAAAAAAAEEAAVGAGLDKTPVWYHRSTGGGGVNEVMDLHGVLAGLSPPPILKKLLQKTGGATETEADSTHVDPVRDCVAELLAEAVYSTARDYEKVPVAAYPSRPALPDRYQVPSEVEVCVPKGPYSLCVKIGNYHNRCVVMGFQPCQSGPFAGGKGPVERTGRVKMGDILIAVNGMYLGDKKMTFEKIVQLIAKLHQPYLYLRFLRCPPCSEAKSGTIVDEYLRKKSQKSSLSSQMDASELSWRPRALRSRYLGVHPIVTTTNVHGAAAVTVAGGLSSPALSAGNVSSSSLLFTSATSSNTTVNWRAEFHNVHMEKVEIGIFPHEEAAARAYDLAVSDYMQTLVTDAAEMVRSSTESGTMTSREEIRRRTEFKRCLNFVPVDDDATASSVMSQHKLTAEAQARYNVVTAERAFNANLGARRKAWLSGAAVSAVSADIIGDSSAKDNETAIEAADAADSGEMELAEVDGGKTDTDASVEKSKQNSSVDIDEEADADSGEIHSDSDKSGDDDDVQLPLADDFESCDSRDSITDRNDSSSDSSEEEQEDEIEKAIRLQKERRRTRRRQSDDEDDDDDDDDDGGSDEEENGWGSGSEEEEDDWVPTKKRVTFEPDGPVARLLRAVNESAYPPARADWSNYIVELGYVKNPNGGSETAGALAGVPIGKGKGNGRKINQLDMVSQEFVRSWDSVGMASKALNIPLADIISAVQGKTDSAGGFCWQYQNQTTVGMAPMVGKVGGEANGDEDEELQKALEEARRELEDDTELAAEMRKDDSWKSKLPTKSKVYKSGGTLRDYQVEGLSWLLRCWYNKRSSILADEMGLGKTVQVVSFLEHLFEVESIKGPYLVVVPLSTIGHWKREFDLWSNMSTCLYHDVGGGRDMRDVIREYEWYYQGRSRRVLKFHVLITTYDDLTRDYEELAEIPWRAVIVDEAHRLRNQNSKLLECLRAASTKGLVAYGYQHRVLMTGTPLQNNTVELWSLLNFIEPAKFPDLEKFEQRFGKITTQDQVEMLQRRIAPHLLRRVKEDVAKDIPPKEETIIDVELTTMQKQYYRAIFERNHGFLMQSLKGNMPKLMNIQMELRKCCNHPFLIQGVEYMEMDNLESAISKEASEAATASGGGRRSQVGSTDESLVGRDAAKANQKAFDHRRMEEVMIPASGKLVLLDKLLPKLRKEGHKVLIFSQMVKMIDLVEEYCEHRKFPHERLDGRVGGNDRQKAIDRYNRDESSFVFLLSTRAGGVGINLTAADTCIIFDSDWNPQNDIQAMARCHRIGQKKSVTIYRLITRRSFESEMFERASKKLGLEQAVLGTRDFAEADFNFEENEKANAKMNAVEMEQLLREGAYAVLLDNSDDYKEFYEEDIEKILEKRTHVIVEKSGAPTESWLNKKKAQGRTNKRLFTGESAKEHAEIDVDDPDFWKKVLPDLVTPDMMLERLKDGTLYEEDDYEKTAVQKYMKDMTQMMDGMLDLNRRNQLPERERSLCLKLLLRLTIKEDTFDEVQIAQAQEWLSVMEGTRSRRARTDLGPPSAGRGRGGRGAGRGAGRGRGRGRGGRGRGAAAAAAAAAAEAAVDNSFDDGEADRVSSDEDDPADDDDDAEDDYDIDSDDDGGSRRVSRGGGRGRGGAGRGRGAGRGGGRGRGRGGRGRGRGAGAGGSAEQGEGGEHDDAKTPSKARRRWGNRFGSGKRSIGGDEDGEEKEAAPSTGARRGRTLKGATSTGKKRGKRDRSPVESDGEDKDGGAEEEDEGSSRRRRIRFSLSAADAMADGDEDHEAILQDDGPVYL